MTKVGAIIKDFQALIALLGISGTVALANIEKTFYYMDKYSVHILICVLIFMYISDKKKQKEFHRLESQIQDSIQKTARDNLRANVKQLSNDLADVEVIDKVHTIKYIYDLEERRKELGVNSYTQQTIEDMVKRIHL